MVQPGGEIESNTPPILCVETYALPTEKTASFLKAGIIHPKSRVYSFFLFRQVTLTFTRTIVPRLIKQSNWLLPGIDDPSYAFFSFRVFSLVIAFHSRALAD